MGSALEQTRALVVQRFEKGGQRGPQERFFPSLRDVEGPVRPGPRGRWPKHGNSGAKVLRQERDWCSRKF